MRHISVDNVSKKASSVWVVVIYTGRWLVSVSLQLIWFSYILYISILCNDKYCRGTCLRPLRMRWKNQPCFYIRANRKCQLWQMRAWDQRNVISDKGSGCFPRMVLMILVLIVILKPLQLTSISAHTLTLCHQTHTHTHNEFSSYIHTWHLRWPISSNTYFRLCIYLWALTAITKLSEEVLILFLFRQQSDPPRTNMM